MLKNLSKNNNHGFTIIEALIVLVLIIGLLIIIIAGYSGVQTKNRNSKRETNIKLIHNALEQYYAQYNQYPTLAELNNSSWVANNLKNLNPSILKDPSGKSEELSFYPKKNTYSYTVTSISGSQCNNTTIKCGQYILTAELEGGSGKFTDSSLN
jgi:type II secretory pathway pseudopilin PulG